MKNTENAFQWITGLLDRHGIAYTVSGGLAARVRGVNRELADIDLDVADADIAKIVDEVNPYIIFGPAHYRDDHWDLYLLTLNYEGQAIDIGGTQAKIFNQQTNAWETRLTETPDVEMKNVFGKCVPVESWESLISYKTKLARDVDLEDVRQLKKLAHELRFSH
jgi:hypothetical protein